MRKKFRAVSITNITKQWNLLNISWIPCTTILLNSYIPSEDNSRADEKSFPVAFFLIDEDLKQLEHQEIMVKRRKLSNEFKTLNWMEQRAEKRCYDNGYAVYWSSEPNNMWIHRKRYLKFVFDLFSFVPNRIFFHTIKRKMNSKGKEHSVQRIVTIWKLFIKFQNTFLQLTRFLFFFIDSLKISKVISIRKTT